MLLCLYIYVHIYTHIFYVCTYVKSAASGYCSIVKGSDNPYAMLLYQPDFCLLNTQACMAFFRTQLVLINVILELHIRNPIF